jgi:hypothetical protein
MSRRRGRRLAGEAGPASVAVRARHGAGVATGAPAGVPPDVAPDDCGRRRTALERALLEAQEAGDARSIARGDCFLFEPTDSRRPRSGCSRCEGPPALRRGGRGPAPRARRDGQRCARSRLGRGAPRGRTRATAAQARTGPRPRRHRGARPPRPSSCRLANASSASSWSAHASAWRWTRHTARAACPPPPTVRPSRSAQTRECPSALGRSPRRRARPFALALKVPLAGA